MCNRIILVALKTFGTCSHSTLIASNCARSRFPESVTCGSAKRDFGDQSISRLENFWAKVLVSSPSLQKRNTLCGSGSMVSRHDVLKNANGIRHKKLNRFAGAES